MFCHGLIELNLFNVHITIYSMKLNKETKDMGYIL
jgi:hypothetical protein